MIPNEEQLKQVEAILLKDKKLQRARARIERAVKAGCKKVTLEQALEQIKRFEAIRGKTKG